MTNRGAIVAAFVAGAMLVAVAVVAYGAAPTAEMSLAEKKAALAVLRHQTTQKLDTLVFGADTFGTTGKESGNLAKKWNVGAQGFKHHGAKAGTFGKWAIDVKACDDHNARAGTRGCREDEVPSCTSWTTCVSKGWINDGWSDCNDEHEQSLHCYCAEQENDCKNGIQWM